MRRAFQLEDKCGFRAGDTNLYRFVANNPTNATDPTGLVLVIDSKPFVQPGKIGETSFPPTGKEFDDDDAYVRFLILDHFIYSNKEFRYTREQLEFEIKMRLAVLRAVKDFHKSRPIRFVPGGRPFGNVVTTESEYWEGADQGIKMKGGVKPADALRDLFRKESNTRSDCYCMLYLFHLKAALDVLGDERFNRHFTTIVINGPKSTDSVGFVGRPIGDPPRRSSRRFLPGDWRYFHNPGFDMDNHPAVSGENVIQMEKDDYYGFPEGRKTERRWVEYLNERRVKPSFIESALGAKAPDAYLTGRITPVDYGKLGDLK